MSNEGTREKVVLEVEGMTCNHCAGKVKDALAAVEGVTGTDVDMDSGRASIEGDNLTGDTLTKAVGEAGYQATIWTG